MISLDDTIWSMNIIFFTLTQSDTTLIQASMTYCANIIDLALFVAGNCQPCHNFFLFS